MGLSSLKAIPLLGAYQLALASKSDESVDGQILDDSNFALLTSHRIAAPYWGTNKLYVKRFDREDSICLRSVEVDAHFLEREFVCLKLEGQYTIPTVGTDVAYELRAFQVEELIDTPGRGFMLLQLYTEKGWIRTSISTPSTRHAI